MYNKFWQPAVYLWYSVNSSHLSGITWDDMLTTLLYCWCSILWIKHEVTVKTSGSISLTFHELSKIFFRNLCIADFILLLKFQAEPLYVCQSHALDTNKKFQLEILIIFVISGIVYFCEIILESLWIVSETTSWFWSQDENWVNRMAALPWSLVLLDQN